MGARTSRQFNINSAAFLGTGDKHCTYLNYFYEHMLIGDDDTKFELFKELVCNNEDLQKVMEDNDIDMPSDSKTVSSQGGFFDSLTEAKAEIFYKALYAAIPSE